MKGFKITDINFHQVVTLPAGVYTYSCKATPVGSSITFRVGSTDYVIDSLTPGVYQKGIKKTFTIETDQSYFYPSRTVGDEIFEPQLEEGTVATTAGPHILDASEEVSRAGIEITDEMVRTYATKVDVSSEIIQTAESINARVSNAEGRIGAVEVTADSIATRVSNAEGRIGAVEVTADSITTRVSNAEGWIGAVEVTPASIKSSVTKSGQIASQILQEDGTVKITAEQIELEGSETADGNFVVNVDGTIKAKGAEIEGKITANEGILGALTMQSGGYIDLPPTFTSRKGRLDNNGLALIYDGANSQKIEWSSGLGTFSGQITCNSQGRLNLYSSYGIEMAIDSLSYNPIRIMADGFNHKVDFGGAELTNMRKISSIGQINMAYTTHALSADTKYHLATDATLIVITSAGSGAAIYRITGPDNSTPSNGDVKIITNAATSAATVVLMATKPSTATYSSNIKVPTSYDGSDFNLHENSSITLVYYGGYWRVQTDRGQ